MDRKQASSIKKAIKTSRINCRVCIIGTGKHVKIGIWGASAASVAQILDRRLTRTPMSMDGSSRLKMITFDK